MVWFGSLSLLILVFVASDNFRSRRSVLWRREIKLTDFTRIRPGLGIYKSVDAPEMGIGTRIAGKRMKKRR
jgi:hypothetical protein